jgi:hypothetical protein
LTRPRASPSRSRAQVAITDAALVRGGERVRERNRQVDTWAHGSPPGVTSWSRLWPLSAPWPEPTPSASSSAYNDHVRVVERGDGLGSSSGARRSLCTATVWGST